MDEWKDPQFAKRWDAGHLEGNPAREAHLKILEQLLSTTELPDGPAVDLGAGSGIVTELLSESLSDRKIVGLDGSDAMLELARQRLGEKGGRIRLRKVELQNLVASDLPNNMALVVCIQTLHNLAAPEQSSLVKTVGKQLAKGGWFILIDRVLADPPELYQAFKAAKSSTPGAGEMPADWEGYQRFLEQKGDQPQSVEAILQNLRAAGLTAATIDQRADRVFIAAVKN